MHKDHVHERIKRYSCTEITEIVRELNIKDKGCTDSELSDARQQYGSNQLNTHRQDTVRHCIRRAFINPFSVILFVLGIITFAADVCLRADYQKNMTSVFIIFFMLMVSGSVRLIQELRSRNVAEKLIRLVNTTVKVLRNGEWVEISSAELVVGDQIQVSAGERVPADIRITDAVDLFVSQSVITGESAILEKTSQTCMEEPGSLTDFHNILFDGTTITGGQGRGIVLAVGRDTVYGGIDVSRSVQKNGFDQGANSIARVLIRFMVILVPIVFLASGITKGNWLEAFAFALSVAVGLTPELLPMVVNACLARGSTQMGQKKTIVKNINAMQSFGSMDVLCVDKTGTLTGDTVLLEYYMDILGNESRKTLDYGYLASFYHTGVGNHLDSGICKASQMPGQETYYQQLVEQHPKYDERPFDYSRRYSSVLVEGPESPFLIIKGSIDEVIQKCNRTEYNGVVSEFEENPVQSVHAVVDEMLEDGMKVIAVAYKPLADLTDSSDEENDFILLGYLAFFDAPKKSAASAIQKLRNQSVNIKVLTGDQALVARSICLRLHLDFDRIITGSELERIPEHELPIVIEKNNVFAELSPKQKSFIIQMLQTNGHTVGFLGDGMNDLPSVLQADVGISVENAVESVKESADVILLKKDLNVLEEGIIEGRKAFSNMSKYIKITASSNFGNICAVVVASVLLPFLPMTSIQLLLLNLLYDILCLVLPWDHVDADLLSGPLEWSGKTLGKFMLYFGPLSSVFDIVTYAFLFFVLCPSICGGSYAALAGEQQQLFVSLFQTGWFLESMWTQILILQLLRTKKLPFIQSRPGKMVVIVTIAGILLFTMLPVTSFGMMVGLTRLPALYYIFLVLVVIMYLLLVTFMKMIYVKINKMLI